MGVGIKGLNVVLKQRVDPEVREKLAVDYANRKQDVCVGPNRKKTNGLKSLY